jgi:hypothetical protein
MQQNVQADRLMEEDYRNFGTLNFKPETLNQEPPP